MQLLGPQGHILPDQRACKCTGDASPGGRRERQRDSLLEAMGHVAAKAHVSALCQCKSLASKPQASKSQRAFLCSPGTIWAWVWDRPGAFSCLGWVLLPTNPIFPQARLRGLFGPEPPPAAILTSMAHVPAFPRSYPPSGTGR